MCIFASLKVYLPATATAHHCLPLEMLHCFAIFFLSRWIWMHRQPGLGTEMERVAVSGVSGPIVDEGHEWVRGLTLVWIRGIQGEFIVAVSDLYRPTV
jgi:hypothetical protein